MKSNKVHWLMIFFSFGIIILEVNTQNNQPNCQQALMQAINQIGINKDMNSDSNLLLYNSGKNFNDLGNYGGCTSNENTSYYTQQLYYYGTLISVIGLCLPNTCTQEVLMNNSQNVTKQFNQTFFKMSNGKIGVNQVVYYSPIEQVPEWTFGDILSLLLIILLFSLGCIASYIDIKRKKISLIQQQNVPALLLPTQQESDIGQKQFESNLKPKRQSKLMASLMCFSYYENIRKLFTIRQSGDNQFDFFNGFRVLMITWVILGHDLIYRFLMIKNYADQQYIATQWGWFTVGAGGYFAVDSFFFMAAFLGTVIALEKFGKKKRISPLVYPQLLFHRFFRIWPTYMVVLMVDWHIYYHLGSGPYWFKGLNVNKFCNKNGWENVLFIDNLYSHGNDAAQYCFGWGWYLSNDIQFFIITPLIWFAFHYNKFLGFILNTAIFIATSITSYSIVDQNNYHINYPMPHARPQPDFMDNYYFKPWTRIGPYLIGIYIGMFYRMWKLGSPLSVKIVDFILNSKITKWIMWIIGMTLMQYMIWCIVPIQSDYYNWEQWQHSLYTAFAKLGFVIGLTLFFLPSLLGNKDWIRSFLGASFWVPFARVSFCVYLVHLMIIFYSIHNQNQLIYYDYTSVFRFFFSDVVLSFFFGAIASMLIESPCLNFEKILMPQREEVGSHEEIKKPLLKDEQSNNVSQQLNNN